MNGVLAFGVWYLGFRAQGSASRVRGSKVLDVELGA